MSPAFAPAFVPALAQDVPSLAGCPQPWPRVRSPFAPPAFAPGRFFAGLALGGAEFGHHGIPYAFVRPTCKMMNELRYADPITEITGV